MEIGDLEIKNGTCEMLLVVYFDHVFDYHVPDLSEKICTSKSQSIHEFIKKKNVNEFSFFDLQFIYCPLILMCHNRSNNKKIKLI